MVVSSVSSVVKHAFGISLEVFWLRRSDPRLQLADAHSRDVDIDDWSVDAKTWEELCHREGPFAVDLFASDKNKRLTAFFSKMPSEEALGPNAFLADWGKLGRVFACPPPRLISAVLQKFAKDKASGGLIIPLWYSLYAWRFVCEDGKHLNRIFSTARVVYPYLKKGPQVTSDVFSGFTPFPFLSLGVRGEMSEPFKSVLAWNYCLDKGCHVCMST